MRNESQRGYIQKLLLNSCCWASGLRKRCFGPVECSNCSALTLGLWRVAVESQNCGSVISADTLRPRVSLARVTVGQPSPTNPVMCWFWVPEQVLPHELCKRIGRCPGLREGTCFGSKSCEKQMNELVFCRQPGQVSVLLVMPAWLSTTGLRFQWEMSCGKGSFPS